MKRQNKNWPLHFEAGCRKRRLNPASFFGLYCVVVLFSGLVNVCFCCVRFSFSIPSQEIGSGNVSEMTYFVWSGTYKTTTQSISQSVPFTSVHAE